MSCTSPWRIAGESLERSVKPRFSIARCCCGGVPPDPCLICDLGSCGWTPNGLYLQSDTLHPYGNRRGVIGAELSFPSIGDSAWIAWDFTSNTSLNYLLITRDSSTQYTAGLYQRATPKDSYSRFYTGTTLSACIRYDETTAFATIDTGTTTFSVYDLVSSTTSTRIARRTAGSTAFNSLSWYHHPDDKSGCPDCLTSCPDCCTGVSPFAWQINIAGPLTNNFYDQCSSINGIYTLPVSNYSGCEWIYIHSTGNYNEGIPTCSPKTATMRFRAYLQKSGLQCRLVLELDATFPVDPAESCFGVDAIYATPYAPVGTYCSGTHTLNLTNAPNVCGGYPSSIQATAIL